MFWRFGNYAISKLETLLEKSDVALEELLDEGDVIQELKQQNKKLHDYLGDEERVRKMLEYVIGAQPPPDSSEDKENESTNDPNTEGAAGSPPDSSPFAADIEREKQDKKRKYAYMSCEILSSDVSSITETLMAERSSIRFFWTFLDRSPPLDPLQASYFTKVNETLLDKKTDEMILFIRSLEGIVPKILKHVDCPMIMDLLLKIISMEKIESGQGIVDWLHSQDLIPLLLSFLAPDQSASIQTSSGDFIKALITISANASQNEQSCIGPNDLTRQLVSEECIKTLIGYMLQGGNPLTVGVGIIIEVIRKNNSDYDPDIGTGIDSVPSSRDPIYLGDLLRIFASHVPDFMRLILSHGITMVENPDGTKTEKRRELKVAFGGTVEPLGFDRFKTCELMAELLHCSNMGLLNEKGGERYVKERDRERDRLKAQRLEELATQDTQSDTNGISEEVMVEKTALHVQNGGVEPSDDGINEEDFEDVTVTGMDEKDKEDEDEPVEVYPAEARPDEVKKSIDEDDLFVDMPLTPMDTAEVTPAKEAESAPQVAPSVVAPILADEVPEIKTSSPEPKEEKPESNPTEAAATEPTATEAAKEPEKDDVEMEDRPPVPPKDDEVNPLDVAAPVTEIKTEEGPTIVVKDKAPEEGQTIPKAPSPPPAEGGADETERKALAEDIKSDPEDANIAKGAVPLERLDADLPLPPEDVPKPLTPSASSSAIKDEDLLAITGISPDTTIADGDISLQSLKSFGSNFTEYQTMIETDVDGNPVVGDYLKMMFVEHSVVPTILDFFFRFPWNNFLHNVVYDVVQQVFNGPMDRGYNRALAIDLFVTGRITERIVEGQRQSDNFEAERKMRLGYMGHLTLIAEEVVKFAERHPPEILGHKVLEKVADPLWIEYVEDVLSATRDRDNAILGGVRPDMQLGPRIGQQAQAFNEGASQGAFNSNLEQLDLPTSNGGAQGSGAGALLSSGFGSSSDEEDDDMEHDEDDDEVARLGLTGSSSDQFASYISQEITSVDKFGSSDEDDDDDDDDDMTFAAPQEPPPPPPPTLPLNIRRKSSEDTTAKGKEVAAEQDNDSSDDEDFDRPGGPRAKPAVTREARTRAAIEDDDDDILGLGDDAVTEGLKALSISPPATAGALETKRAASGEFVTSGFPPPSKKEETEPAEEEDPFADPFDEKVAAVEEEEEVEAPVKEEVEEVKEDVKEEKKEGEEGIKEGKTKEPEPAAESPAEEEQQQKKEPEAAAAADAEAAAEPDPDPQPEPSSSSSEAAEKKE